MLLGIAYRAAGIALAAMLLRPVALAAQNAAPDPRVEALLGIIRSHSLASAAADAATEAARMGARADVLPDPMTLGLSAEGVPDGVRLDRAGQILATAEWRLWRGGSARARQDAAEARVEVFERWRAVSNAATDARARADLARFSAAVLRRERLDAEAALLGEAEQALANRVAAGEARYLDVLRLRTARLQVAAEISQEVADAASARTAVLAGLPAGSARDSATTLLAGIDHATALATLAASDPTNDDAGIAAYLDAVGRANQVAVASRLRSRDPSLDAMLGVERFGGPAEGWSLGPALGVRMNLPLPGSPAGARIARAAEAEQLAIGTELAVRAARALAARDAGRSQVAAARERLALLSSALLEGAPAERAAATTAFTAGRLSLLELLDFERALSRITLERLDALRDAAVGTATSRLGVLEPYLTLDLLLGAVP